MDKNSPLAQLAGVPELIKEITGVFAKAPGVFTDPEFLFHLVGAGIEVATAKDDESRREIIQVEVIKLQRRFKK